MSDITQKPTVSNCQSTPAELRQICSMVPTGIFTTDTEGTVTFWNCAAEEITGYNHAEITGNLCDYFVPSQPAQPEELCARFCRGEMKNFECSLRHKEGHIISVLLSSNAITDSNGTITGVVASMTDVTYFHDIETKYRNLSETVASRFSFGSIIGRSSAMQRVYHMLERAAESDATVLLLGESGTGKELAARAIHYASARKHESLVTVNCSAFPDTLLESELFGHVKGAFTGAIRDTIGRFEAADKGTLFLDEIGDISPLIQVKLLRVLQEKTFDRLGDHKPRHVDVRIIAATNKDLKKMVAEGRFREDLYYRLKVFPITLPPLRNRREDLPMLIDHFIGTYNESTGKYISKLSREAMKHLLNYCWPGNVRELQNAIEHAFVLCTANTIETSHLPQEIVQHELRIAECGHHLSYPANPSDERSQIVDALSKSNGQKTAAARLLGISRVTLWKKIKKYEINSNTNS